jgi:signal transduction histidine kinase/DNA-binding response OmpR family regulator
MRLKVFVIFLLLLLIPGIARQVVFAQNSSNTGFKYFKNYDRLEYGNTPQNWCIVQDKSGIIYVANQGGLLEFDGVSWRSIDIPNNTVYSITIDETGTVYVGGKNEIGYLIPNINGTLQYQSLTVHLKQMHGDFGNVWQTHSAKGGIYFQTSSFLFKWRGGKMDVWKAEPKTRFLTSFSIDGKFFVHQRPLGLKYIEDNFPKPVPGSDQINDAKIYMITPYDTKRLLIGTRNKGFYIYNGRTMSTFRTEADDYLKEKQLYYGVRLVYSPGNFALATHQGGVVIIDSQGRLKHIFDISYGLPVNRVRHIFEDLHGNLWLSLNKGITKIEYASPISYYDARSGLSGIVLSTIRHRGVLYAGTYTGLYSLSTSGIFNLAAGLDTPCWALLSTGDYLLTATTQGVFQVELKNNTFFKWKIAKYKSYVLQRSKQKSNRIWLGTEKGLVSLSQKGEDSQWEEEYKFENIATTIKSIVEDEKGNLWLGLSIPGVFKVTFPGDGTIVNPEVKLFGKAHGLPEKSARVVLFKDHVMFATEDGLYRFDEDKQGFVPDRTLGDQFAGGEKGRGVFRIEEDSDKNIWLHSDGKNILAVPRPDGSYIISEKPFLSLPRDQANAIYPDPGGDTIWFASYDALIRYDKNIKKNYNLNFSAIIRKVMVNGNLIFEGCNPGVGHNSKIEKHFPVIEYENRNLRFQFVAPFFEAESKTQYEWRLDGYDEGWSGWTTETQKDYTNLHADYYNFRVRAKNVYENISREAQFQFKVLPPWYRTWWAYLLYATAVFFAVFLLLKWRSRKLVQEKEKLEHIVHQRTQEVKDKNRQLEEQSEKLKEMDKIKSRFFANISHEFRTPLTLLMGPLEQMIAACGENEKEKKRKLTLMLRNAQRLLRLINQLLELSKLDSGKMKLQAVKTHIVSFLKGIADSFRFMAHQKELDLVFCAETEAEDIILYIDPRKMEDIMSNLLINAVKFTPPGGEITVTIKSFCGGSGGDSPRFLEKSPLVAEGKNNFPEGSMEISVSDTGPGIPAEQLPHIFDRFYQADSTYEFHEKGSGIGLALCKELVELHHGTITVRSREGEGSTFIIRLPVGEAHLAPDEQGVPTELNVSAPAEGVPALKIVMKEEENGSESEPGTGIDFDSETGMDEKNIILVVEDSADMRDYIRGALEPVYTVVDAEDGQQGIQKAQEIIPDLIISDIMMPGVDGYELCRVLKNDVQTSHIPIILLTARASEENILQGLETGADDYITKPFNTKILEARIKNLIDIRSQLQKNLNREMTLQPVKTSVSKIDREFLKELQDVIKKNLSDPEFNVEELCKKLYMGNTTLYRKIQALCGQTPTEFIRSCRLKRAAQLLESGFGSVTEVAFEVGFSSRTYFTKCFKQRFNQLPSNFKEIE